MILDLMQSGGDIRNIVSIIFAYAIILLVALPVHECCHGFAAKLLGDNTAFNLGRVTLNPLAHMDPVGAIGILTVGIGWAKPVPVNPTGARKVSARAAMALTAAAGPVSNILVSLIFMILGKLIFVLVPDPEISIYFYHALITAAQINVSLAVFNMLPIPPFDGSRIVLIFLKEKTYFKIMQYERYIMIAILLLCWTGALSVPLGFLTDAVMNFLDLITRFIL